VNTIHNELVLDDYALIPHHKALQSPWDLSAIFNGRYWGDLRVQDTLYRPLTIWTLALNAGLNKTLGLEHPAGYHLINLFLHAGVSALFYHFILQLGLSKPTGLFAALLFAVHPIHTEAVASIVNRSELLAALFGLLFLILHLRASNFGLSLCCLFLALFSKESALLWVPLIVWMDLVLAPQKRSWSRYGAYSLVLIAWFGCRNLAVAGILQAIPPLDNPLAVAPLGHRLLTAFRIQFDYIILQVFPIHLSSDYSWNQIPIIQTPVHSHVIGFFTITLVLLSVAWKTRHTHPHILFAIGGYAILFALTSNLILPIGTIMGERLAYNPSLFFCLLAGMGAQTACQKWNPYALYAIVFVLLLFSGRTLARNQVWSTPHRFYHAQIQSAPQSARAHYAIARSVFHKTKDLGNALIHYRRAVEILPNFPDAWNSLGLAYKDKGDLPSAIQAYQQAIAFHNTHREAYYNLGLAYQQQGSLEQARQAYEKALQFNPDHPPTYNNLATLYIHFGNPDKAILLLQKALRLNPDYDVARHNLERLTK
ncbi:MAG: tetratricopeptide repeat protein, partial [bacterium]|nr:tetratricopeptide repeat protein [bacterium]